MNNTLIIFDFNKKSDVSNWEVVDDVVMGGCSSGHFKLNSDGYGVFEGTVSLENNGGFSLVRYRFNKLEISKFKKIKLRIKGDGKKYQLRLKSDKYDQQSYVAYFQTTNEWQTVEIALQNLQPFFRGKKLNMHNYPAILVEEIGFLLGNKQSESFKLLLTKIGLE